MVQRSVPRRKVLERTFPVRVLVQVPGDGFGNQLNELHAWLSERTGPDGYALHSANVIGYEGGMHVYLNDLRVAGELVDRFGLKVGLDAI